MRSRLRRKLLKKKKRESGKQFLQIAGITAVLLAYFLFIFTNYAAQMKDSATEIAEEELAYHGEELVSDINLNTAKIAQVSQTVAGAISLQRDMKSVESLDLLQAAVDTSDASYGFISDTKGAAIDTKGKNFDVWTNDYFAQASAGVSVISDIMPNPETGVYVISFYSPIITAGEIRGVVALDYAADSFIKIAKGSDRDGRAIYGLLKKDGTLLSLTGNEKIEDGTNLYDIIGDDVNADKGSAEKKLKQNLDNNKSGQQYLTVNDVQKYICYTNIGMNGWYVLQIYPKDYFNRMIQYRYNATQEVTFKIFIALFLFFAIAVVFVLFNRMSYKKKNSELQNKAETDLLTGLLNKIATEKHIQEYIDGEGEEVPGMLFVLDVDNFKKINDTMGHAFGDQVLSTLGIKLRNQFRSTDIIGRIGGDEFMVYLKNIPNEEARKREATKMINFFRDFQAGDYVKYSATASIGVSVYPDDGKNFEALYKAADKGVYLSKQRGKNQLAFYSETKDIKE